MAVLAVLLSLWFFFPKLNKKATEEASSEPETKSLKLLNIDFDLVKTCRRTYNKSRRMLVKAFSNKFFIVNVEGTR